MHRAFAKYALIVLVAAAVGAILTVLSKEQHLAYQRERVSEGAASFVTELTQAIYEKALVNKGVSAVFEVDPDLSYARFSEIAETLLADTPDVRNLAVAPDFVIEYVYPLEQNQAAIGLNLRTNPALSESVNRVVAEKTTILDGPFDLVQGGQGFIMRSPVLRADGPAAIQSVWGVISLVIEKDEFFRSTGFFEATPNLSIAVHNSRGERLFGGPEALESDPIQAGLQLYGIDWVVSVVPAGGWAQTSPNAPRLWAVVAVFTILALIVMRAFDQAARERLRAETQLAEAIEALEDGFALYDKDDRLIACNQRYKDMYQVSADAMVIGRKFEDILRYGLKNNQYLDAVGREEEWLVERLKLHKSYGTPTEQKLIDGRWLRVIERRTPSGNTVGFRVDITSLKEALAKAESANAAKSYFLNAVSHELRTPLTVVMGYNTFLANPAILPTYKALVDTIRETDHCRLDPKLAAYTDDIKRFSKQIETAGQHLMTLINGILDLAALEEGTLQLRRKVVSLSPICASVLENLRPAGDKKGLTLRLEGDADNVFADPVRIQQIVHNLVGNAIKFSCEGEVLVRLSTVGDKVYVDVKDHGAGLNSEDIAVIFDRFGQLDKSNARANDGIGLGLPISRELAELHGGTLEVRSTKGEGSVFRLQLSAHRGQSEEAA